MKKNKTNSLTNKTVIILDGITLSHAGELLYHPREDTSNIKFSKYTYKRSLEDFMYTLAYGSFFSTSGQIPKIDEFDVGETIISSFNNKFYEISEIDRQNPTEFMKINLAKTAFVEYASYLETEIYVSGNFWIDYIFRELNLYLGKDTSLKQELPPKEYVFAKNPPFLEDQKLQDKIPEIFVKKLKSKILENRYYKTFHHKAIEEFIKRSILTHIIIFSMYDYCTKNYTNGNYVRQPHITRSMILLNKFNLDKHAKLRTLVTELEVPTVYRIINNVHSRDQLIDRLKQIHLIEPFNKFRAMLNKLILMENKEEFDNEYDSILKAIYNLQNDDNQTPAKIKIGSELIQSFNAELSADVKIDKITLSKKRFLRQLFDTKNYSYEKYIQKLNELFPELEL